MREGRSVLRERNHVLPELHQTRGSRRRDEINLHVLQSYEHRLRQRRGLEKARELLVRELPHGIHVVPLSELLDEGSASAAFVSHEFLLHRDVAPLAQAAAELRHEQRLPWRGRELVPLRHGDVATRQAIGAGTQQVELDLRRRREGRVERRKALLTRVAREQDHPSQHRVLRADSLQGALPQHHVELRDAQRQSLERQHDQVLPQMRTRSHSLPRLRGGNLDPVPVRVQPDSARLRLQVAPAMPVRFPVHAPSSSARIRKADVDLRNARQLRPCFRFDTQDHLRLRCNIAPRNRQITRFVRHFRPQRFELGLVGSSGLRRDDRRKALETLSVIRLQGRFLRVPEHDDVAGLP